jgi:hypothetical protein
MDARFVTFAFTDECINTSIGVGATLHNGRVALVSSSPQIIVQKPVPRPR